VSVSNETEIVLEYGRVSSLKQKDNFSIGTQLSMMREECEKRGWKVYAEHAEVGSAWAEGLERSELKKALDIAKQKKITMLMFFSADRFTRDPGDGVLLRRELYKLGVKLFCFYPTPREVTEDMELLHIITDFGSSQQVKIQRDKSMGAVRSKVLLGLYPQGNVPYGYTLEGKRRETVIR
jgi:site-specific DNA recombinase